MAAIVTTMLCWPVAALLALFCFAALGISFEVFMTFGGVLNGVQGMLAWWFLCFLPTLAYTVYMLPWDQKEW